MDISTIHVARQELAAAIIHLLPERLPVNSFRWGKMIFVGTHHPVHDI
jgi:hypothetical protein